MAKTLTPAELYEAGADHHHTLTPERAQDMVDIIADVSARQGAAQAPRLAWLKRVADGKPPKT